MEQLIRQPDNSFLAAFQPVSGSVEALFQAVELFPIPIQIFAPDGLTVYVNHAVLAMWDISDRSQIVGQWNLRTDPIVNGRMGYADCIRRIFEGEIMVVPDVRAPLDAFTQWYHTRRPGFDVESMYTDVLNFPIRDAQGAISHIVSAFLSTKLYLGKADIACAKEYIGQHWLEAFDLDAVAGIVHLSRYHFARLFKKHTGMTPYGYYQQVKIGHLKHALRDANLSVTDAFSACGLAYSGSMARTFRKYTGMTPSQYRRTE